MGKQETSARRPPRRAETGRALRGEAGGRARDSPAPGILLSRPPCDPHVNRGPSGCRVGVSGSPPGVGEGRSGVPRALSPCAVVYVCCAPETLRELMLQAGREGLTGGDYVFFYIDIFGASLQGGRFPEPQRPWKRGDRHDASARQAFEVSTRGTGTHRQWGGAGAGGAAPHRVRPPRCSLPAATKEEGNEFNSPGSLLRRCPAQRLLIEGQPLGPVRDHRPHGDRAVSPAPLPAALLHPRPSPSSPTRSPTTPSTGPSWPG